MKNLKEKSIQLRKDLKVYGLTNRDVSITTQNGVWDDKINVHLKTISALKLYNEIEKLAYKYENIDRDVRTMEILTGGNTYIFISYEYNLLDEYSAKYQTIAEELFSKASSDHMIPIKVLENVAYYGIIEDTNQICYNNKFREVRTSNTLAKKLAMIELFGKI